MDYSDADNFSDSAWELLGEYIASNEYLECVDLESCRSYLTDSAVSSLFRNWTRSESLKKLLDLSSTFFGIVGIRNMVPFLKNSRNLCGLDIGSNNNINTECFRVIVEALHIGGSIDTLRLRDCNIKDITALENYFLPHLQLLNLISNNIRGIPSLESYANLEPQSALASTAISTQSASVC